MQDLLNKEPVKRVSKSLKDFNVQDLVNKRNKKYLEFTSNL